MCHGLHPLAGLREPSANSQHTPFLNEAEGYTQAYNTTKLDLAPDQTTENLSRRRRRRGNSWNALGREGWLANLHWTTGYTNPRIHYRYRGTR